MEGKVAFFPRELRVVSWHHRQCPAGVISPLFLKGPLSDTSQYPPHISFNTAIENKEPFANDPLQ